MEFPVPMIEAAAQNAAGSVEAMARGVAEASVAVIPPFAPVGGNSARVRVSIKATKSFESFSPVSVEASIEIPVEWNPENPIATFEQIPALRDVLLAEIEPALQEAERVRKAAKA